MRQRCAGLGTVILEDHNSLKSRIAHQIVVTLLHHAQHMHNLLDGLMGQRRIVLWRVDDHFVGSASTHAAKQRAVLNPAMDFFDPQRGKLVRNYPHFPARRIARTEIADCGNLRGRQLFVTRTNAETLSAQLSL